MDKNDKELADILEEIPETSFIPTYILLISWMIENDIKKEDLAMACEIFLKFSKSDESYLLIN